MIVDASALIAIVYDEPEAEAFNGVIASAAPARMSAANWLEAAIVVDASGDPVAGRLLDDFVRTLRIVIEPVTVAQAEIARGAYRDFGRGSGHPARLNFGDCFSYALAKDLDEPLLFKGTDFAETDVTPAA